MDVVDFLHMELSTKVYDGEACEIISTVRTVLVLKMLVKTLHELREAALDQDPS